MKIGRRHERRREETASRAALLLHPRGTPPVDIRESLHQPRQHFIKLGRVGVYLPIQLALDTDPHIDPWWLRHQTV